VAKRSAKNARARRSRLLRWSLLGTAALVAFLYYHPIARYVETRASVHEREAEVRQLRGEKERLEARLAESSTVDALAREARRLNLVRPGEKLFIVKGVSDWRRVQAARDAARAGG
jgi:cell division protein FtsB